MRRILLIGSSASLALENFYVDAFRALGVDTTVLDPELNLAFLRKTGVHHRLSSPLHHLIVGPAVEDFVNTHSVGDAVIVFKGIALPARTVRKCRSKSGVPWLNVNPDSPFDRGAATSSRHIRAALPEYDAYFTWSRQLVPRIAAEGCRRVVYLPFGHDPRSHFPAESTDASLARTITFVGTYDRQRAATLEALADLPIRIFGPQWHKLARRSRLRDKVVSELVYGAELRRIVTSSLASINMLRPQNDGSHNMRTFEVPAMGGLMLTTRSAEQDEFFPDGDASLMYEDAAELRLVAEGLLKGKYDTGRIRARSLALAAQHPYRARAAIILSTLAELGASSRGRQ